MRPANRTTASSGRGRGRRAPRRLGVVRACVGWRRASWSLAELGGTATGQGDGGGHGGSKRQRRQLSVVRARGTGEGMSMEGGVRGPGGCVASSRCVGEAAGSRTWHSAWSRASNTRLSSFWREEGDHWQSWWDGPPVGPPGGLLLQVRGQVSFSPTQFSVNVFLFFCNFWALLKIPKRFQKS